MSDSGWSLAIDFGTSFTTAAMTRPGANRAEPVMLEVENSRYLPSVVFRDEAGQLLTGRAAARQAVAFPERAELAPKRALAADSQVILGGVTVPVADLVAAPLRRVYTEAVRYQGERPPDRVVLTHPARWGETLLGRLRDAAGQAGIAEPVLVPEPIAAAWWYARPSSGDLVAVFDLGGVTLGTAVLRVHDRRYEVAGPAGRDASLGGENFDDLLLSLVSELARSRDETEWKAVFSATGPRPGRELALVRQDVTTAKETLSEYLTYDLAVAGLPEAFRLTRAEFEDLIGPLASKAATEMLGTITAAGTSPGRLSGLFLTGGSSRIPLIAARLGDELGIQPRLHGDPKAVVALGALAATDPVDDHQDGVTAQSGPAMFHAGPDHAGVYPSGSRPAAARQPGWTAWKYKVLHQADSPFFSSPTLAAGMVFIGSTDAGGSMYALDALTGALRWQHPVAGGVASSPPAAHEMLYFASADCFLYAADLDSGTPRWRFRAGGPIISSSPPAAPAGGADPPGPLGRSGARPAAGGCGEGRDPRAGPPPGARRGRMVLRAAVFRRSRGGVRSRRRHVRHGRPARAGCGLRGGRPAWRRREPGRGGL